MYYFIFLCIIFGGLLIVIFNIARTYREKPEGPAIRKLLFVEERGPGATVVPNLGNSFIWYNPKSKYEGQVQRYTQVIKDYIEEQKGECRLMFQATGQICTFNETEFGPCGVPSYGYKEGKPCIFLKLNKIPTWFPEKYGSRTILPDEMEVLEKKEVDISRDVVHIHCHGKFPNDDDELGLVKYYPEPIFSEKYFPLPNGRSTNPVVAVQLPNIQPGKLVTIKCDLFAKNIEHNGVFMYFYLDGHV